MKSQNASEPVLLTRREACQRLRVGMSTYKLLVGRSVLREVAIGERGRRCPLSEVERFVREQLNKAGGL